MCYPQLHPLQIKFGAVFHVTHILFFTWPNSECFTSVFLVLDIFWQSLDKDKLDSFPLLLTDIAEKFSKKHFFLQMFRFQRKCLNA